MAGSANGAGRIASGRRRPPNGSPGSVPPPGGGRTPLARTSGPFVGPVLVVPRGGVFASAREVRDAIFASRPGSPAWESMRENDVSSTQPPPEPRPEPPDDGWRQEYWKRNLRLMVVLMVIWATVSFGLGILLVEPLNEIVIAGYPLGFWFAQQGAIYVFLVLILVYALRMDRLDKEFGVDERDEEGNRL